FRFTIIWEKIIVIIEVFWGGRVHDSRGGSLSGGAHEKQTAGSPAPGVRWACVRQGKGIDSEQELLVAAIWRQAQTHLRRAVGAFDG
ncbi:MAG TPA: hypothetical protein VGR84_18340, partial [Candidatus Acidoferrales bacterium]|nr:hypothetical protein [Candidatus Acidoferrales bacterium]